MAKLTRESTVKEWADAAQREGFPHVSGCAFYEWAEGKDGQLATDIEAAPFDAIMEACTTALRMRACGDREYFVKLIDEHSPSEALKRWARHG